MRGLMPIRTAEVFGVRQSVVLHCSIVGRQEARVKRNSRPR
jgi:hypothetical protein